MNQDAVSAVVEALLEDDELVLDLSTLIEKAAVKAQVSSLTTEDVGGVFAGLASVANTQPTRIIKTFYTGH